MSLAAFRREFRLPLSSFFESLGVQRSLLSTAEQELDRFVSEIPTRATHGAVQALRDLRVSGARIGVVSAAGSSVELDIAELGLQSLLDFVEIGVARKREVLRALNVGTRLVYVGDTEYDIQEARASDALAIAYSRGYRPRSALRRAGPDAIIDNLAALRSTVRRLTR